VADDVDQVRTRLSKHSDVLELLERRIGEVDKQLVSIHGLEGDNGKLGRLDEKMTDGFVDISRRLQEQNDAARRFLGWFGAQAVAVIILVIGAAVVLYERLAVLETAMRITKGN
jgi:hypothetical protein